ncbi:MAG: sugar ABC transporter permease [Anaerolineaceae bacterium]|nr:sugar ABC transporter permease [Anaerolineaceae bacterium]MBN2677269.1 sugar ABC transporter permease [Anaerolineaceae bacterium]
MELSPVAVNTKRIDTVKKRNRNGLTPLEHEREKWGYLFLSPWLLGFLLFTLLPILATLVFSMTDYSPVNAEATTFVGFSNFATMLTDDKMWISLWVTIRYAVLAIPVSFIFGLVLALLVNSKHLVGKDVFRTLFYMPSMIPVVAGALVWAGVMNTQTGWINVTLKTVGITGPDWLGEVEWIYPALVLIGLWGLGNLMLTLLAGMQGVPNELYEAAVIDGASGWRQFRHITLPMISPVVFYNMTLMLIGAFKYFDLAYVLKNGTGGPSDATLFYNLNLYKNAFTYNLMGYASALAWVLFLIILILTILLFVTSGRWVYYAAEVRK